MSVISTPFATSTEQLTSFFDASPPREVFEDVDIDYVARLLRHCNHIAQRCPRTYIVLRTVGELDHLERLINERFSDGWFPVDVLRLPSFLDPRVKNKIVQGQHIILTKSLNLENGKHSHFDSQETLPFEELGRIGSGTGGQVDRIESKISFKQYALKRISRRVRYGPTKSRETVDQILVEMKILKSLNHKHVVKYVGSYTNSVHLGIVISPLADMDLSTYMQQASATTQLRPTLQTFFGCLAASINYLHDKEVKHRDIKPQNILIYKSNVLITDFGLSRDFLDTTSGRTSSTPRYCPPEVADWKKRNWSADIWSMGCVFLEMAAALHGHDVMWVRTYYEGHHTRKTHFHANSEATEQLLSEFEASWDEKEKILLTWIRSMMAEDREARPTAARVIELITSVDEPDCSPTTFCGICCATDDSADSVGSFHDDFDSISISVSMQSTDLPSESLVTDGMVEYIELEPLTKVKVRYHFPSMMPFVKGSSHMIYRFSSGVGYVVLGGISYVGPIIKGSGQLIYFFACKPGNVAHGGWIYMTNTISGLASKPYGVALAVLSYCKKPKDDIILIIEIISFIGSIILCAILCTQAMIFKSIIYQFQASIGHIWRTAFRISLPFAGIEAVVYAYILYNCYSVLGCAPTSGFPLFIYVFLSFIIGFCLIGSGYIKDPFEYTVPAGASYTQRKRWEEKEAQKTVGERVVDYVRWLFNLEYRSPVDDRR